MAPVVLTERQARTLWLLSMGHTPGDIARDNGLAIRVVQRAGVRLCELMDAKTIPQAVRNGLLNGFIGPYEDCGTLAAYRRHVRKNEAVCAACKRGNRERVDHEASQRDPRVRLGEPELRLLRAFDAGRTREQVRERWGISRQDLKDLTESVYAALGVDHLAPVIRREAALREARLRGLILAAPPSRASLPTQAVRLSETHLNLLVMLESGATVAEAARRLELRPGTCSTRLSEAYRRLDVGWMAKADRLPAALRKARALGLLPEPATV